MIAEQTVMPEEEEGNGDQNCAEKMPSLSSTVASPRLVAEEPDYGRGCSIGNLTNEQEQTRIDVFQSYDKVKEDEKVGEPHTGTHVVEDVPHTIGQLTVEREVVGGFRAN